MDNMCPDGYICDPYPERCSVGESCSKNTKTNCVYTQFLASAMGYDNILNGTYCEEGSAYIRNCPRGYYCPTAAEKIACPKGFYCPMKSRAPEIKCSRCDEGSMQLYAELESFAIFVGSIAASIICLLVCTRYFKTTAIKSNYLLGTGDCENTSQTLPVQGSDSSLVSRSGKSDSKLTHAKAHDSMSLSLTLPLVTIRYHDISLHRNIVRNGKLSKELVLNGVSGVLRPKRLCAILGESGAGKSTLLNTLSGRVPFRHSKINGYIQINGKKIDIDEWMGSDITMNLTALVPQDDVLYNELTVFENLYWSGRFQMLPSKSNREVRDQVNTKLGLLGLLNVRDQPVNCISGGERRRCSIGVALMAEPRLLILDEPTSGLDASTSVVVMNLLKNLAQDENMTILCSIHQARQAIYSFLDDIVLLGKGGNVLFSGQTSDVANYFEQLGYACPLDTNPADYLLDISTGTLRCTLNGDEITSLSNEWRKHESCLPEPVSGDDPIVKGLATRPLPPLQLWFHIQRKLVILKRNHRIVLTNALVICLASVVITLTHGTTMIAKDEHEYHLSPENQSLEQFPLAEMFLFSTVGPVIDAQS